MQRAQCVKQRAVELARTGEHIDCLTIEITLDREGFADVFDALRDEEFRAVLKGICDGHWKPDACEPPDRPVDRENLHA